MDKVLRNYAHSAWTPADPLDGFDPETRRAILLMPSTFRERWRLAPWTTRHQRRAAIAEIIAERRLMYELTHKKLASDRHHTKSPAPKAVDVKSLSPYYQYRLSDSPDAIATMRSERSLRDQLDRDRLPQAQHDYERRRARRQALIDIDLERTKLDARELHLLSEAESSSAAPHGRSPTSKKLNDKKRQQGRSL